MPCIIICDNHTSECWPSLTLLGIGYVTLSACEMELFARVHRHANHRSWPHLWDSNINPLTCVQGQIRRELSHQEQRCLQSALCFIQVLCQARAPVQYLGSWTQQWLDIAYPRTGLSLPDWIYHTQANGPWQDY